jgi:hypothetical protein
MIDRSIDDSDSSSSPSLSTAADAKRAAKATKVIAHLNQYRSKLRSAIGEHDALRNSISENNHEAVPPDHADYHAFLERKNKLASKASKASSTISNCFARIDEDVTALRSLGVDVPPDSTGTQILPASLAAYSEWLKPSKSRHSHPQQQQQQQQQSVIDDDTIMNNNNANVDHSSSSSSSVPPSSASINVPSDSEKSTDSENERNHLREWNRSSTRSKTYAQAASSSSSSSHRSSSMYDAMDEDDAMNDSSSRVPSALMNSKCAYSLKQLERVLIALDGSSRVHYPHNVDKREFVIGRLLAITNERDINVLMNQHEVMAHTRSNAEDEAAASIIAAPIVASITDEKKRQRKKRREHKKKRRSHHRASSSGSDSSPSSSSSSSSSSSASDYTSSKRKSSLSSSVTSPLAPPSTNPFARLARSSAPLLEHDALKPHLKELDGKIKKKLRAGKFIHVTDLMRLRNLAEVGAKEEKLLIGDGVSIVHSTHSNEKAKRSVKETYDWLEAYAATILPAHALNALAADSADDTKRHVVTLYRHIEFLVLAIKMLRFVGDRSQNLTSIVNLLESQREKAMADKTVIAVMHQDLVMSQMMTQAFTPHASSSSSSSSSTDNHASSNEACRNFNYTKCTYAKCKYAHKCMKCNSTKHPQSACDQKKKGAKPTAAAAAASSN